MGKRERQFRKRNGKREKETIQISEREITDHRKERELKERERERKKVSKYLIEILITSMYMCNVFFLGGASCQGSQFYL